MVQQNLLTEENIWQALQEVKDPEIPPVSMVEMGMIHKVSIESGNVAVQVLPTFVGCPALDIMKKAIIQQVQAVDRVQKVTVDFIFEPAWSSDRISEKGREKLREFGIAPPPLHHEAGKPWKVDCPYCGSPYTTMENLFGPAACRSILYCKHCKNPFEALKPI
ncbi:1,2-phenylacetyl-CoA epoxidase subunit PaaD [Aneurinibacillus aneurinilyticus]|jgi:ring-1,2-phenylacetyl-CoA epoxidase subunit PaaD|uniref:Phenylacetate-CoA oxygenase subunit PaaJ n=2 Tax=Aneurinibacillus aneurinilyticus TaxID=1391 RepID=A0A848D113_ANEAE|nr:1,2-phenylacetyl-CoA epoxidase subunit PaaD [Aneurinibacillus aneurinilyticus]ERI10803.1 phenylacetate-CoA oxygenase, PaaJ subunit [Aneurinibacillus aneurinilyticus ATCC 12856]MCI1694920.1 phenylacetate-CoA oxygenase subunit PaaJ [Aneurinibacillus aneurinilyticus]MED0673585.1 phenylacetate-CoA oxygenase subunit PaaJ [Aneurinibacillus aneurinilyticus]MED0709806.1 phenylacetate-CoA oxygenase subunit PaaJ [Aneurinibacillus aneurinilyticus]MED0726189.1 phenylacetate-CoA oxygenase subunit PaaJ [